MFIFIFVQIITISMFLVFGYLILKKEAYWLISGFAMKTKEEQQELIQNGYPQAVAKGLIYSGFILIAGFLLQLMKIPNAILFSWLVMMAFLMIYLRYVTKLDLERTRKRNRIILTITMVVTFAILGSVFFIGSKPNEVSLSDQQLHISGAYGVDWSLVEITKVELVEVIPRVKMKTNGYAYGERLKGHFRLDRLGTGRLFLYLEHPPFIYIEKDDDFLFINFKEELKTEEWFEAIRNAVKNN